MTKSKLILTGIVPLLAEAGSCLLIQGRMQAEFFENDAVWRQQEVKLAKLTTENRRLSNLVTQTKAAENTAAELEKLRARGAALREQANQLAAELAESRRRATALLQSWEESRLRQHNRIIESGSASDHTAAAGDLGNAATLARALVNYSISHKGEFPENMGQVAQFLTQEMDPDANRWGILAVTNGFEIVYQGSREDLTGVPPHRVALLRELRPWLTADGKWARVYAYADGAANTVVSDDTFQSWDAQHIVPPQTAEQ